MAVKPRDMPDPSGEIDKLIAAIPDWRGKNVRVRPQDYPRRRSGDRRRVQVDGEPGVVARRNHRGR